MRELDQNGVCNGLKAHNYDNRMSLDKANRQLLIGHINADTATC